MTAGEQIEAFVGDVEKVIHRYRLEFQMPVASVIGSLEAVKLALFKEHFIDPEDEDDDDDVANEQTPA